jgi:hypothetical protein
MPMLYVLAKCPCCTCCISILHVLAACPCYMSVLNAHVNAACPRCVMSMPPVMSIVRVFEIEIVNSSFYWFIFIILAECLVEISGSLRKCLQKLTEQGKC